MPCHIKSGAKKRVTKKEKNANNTKKTTKQTKSQATKENRFITDYFPTVSRRILAAQSKIDEYNKRIRQCIETCTDPKENLIVCEFENKGRGIVAACSIKKGGFICEYSGDLINLDQAKVSFKCR